MEPGIAASLLVVRVWDDWLGQAVLRTLLGAEPLGLISRYRGYTVTVALSKGSLSFGQIVSCLRIHLFDIAMVLEEALLGTARCAT
jgi:hypothetical protein